MEFIAAGALKSSFLSEIAMKSSQQVFVDDLWCVKGINNVSCDDFVDDLLNFSDKDFNEEVSEEDFEEKDSLSVSSQDFVREDNLTFSNSFDFGSITPAEFNVPVDVMENLEWLSQFVDDSTSEVSMLCPTGYLKERTGKSLENQSEPGLHVPYFKIPVPTKARSKRPRPSGRLWSLVSPSLSESSSLTSSSSVGSVSSSLILTNRFVQTVDSISSSEKPSKKQKRKPRSESGSGSSGSQTQRKCSHCQVQKTPQWRTGPCGAKTLCNACGVRFKSGRLFPEYRPACSPTFMGDVHSNSHRKVLEMRQMKEIVGVVESGSEV